MDITQSLSMFVYVYFCFKIVDIIVGICKAFYKNEFNTKVMRNGILVWIGELSAIALLAFLDTTFALAHMLVDTTVSLFIFKEYSSITRNLQELGINLPNIVEITIRSLIGNSEEDE